MRKVFVRLYIVCLAVIVLAGETRAQHDPAAVIESSLRAIGNAKDIAAVRNIHAFADCTGPRRNYTTELSSGSGSTLIFRQVFPGEIYQGQMNGQILWTRDEKTGDHTLADSREAYAWRSHDFQRLAVEIGTRFKDLTFDSEEGFEGKPALEYRATDELGKPARLFFHKNSKILLGLVIQSPFSASPEPIKTVFNEWTQVGKLKLPSKVTVTDKTGDFVLNFKKITINKIDETIFAVPPRVTAMTELLAMHNEGRKAHFDRDANLLVSGFADDYTSLGRGKIDRPTREASLARFTGYFSNSTFLEWDDIAPPVIKVSDDATMGYVIVHKRVRLLARDEKGVQHEETEVYSWLANFRKINGKWKLTAIASTNTPGDDK
jgi:hypothetical protein